jgi:CheY-like chemotaxis protein
MDDHGRILVVDDNRLNRVKLAHGLKQEGHTVALAENGRQALDMVRAQPFDLLLLDIVMPEMDGYQVLEQMKGNSVLRDIPVIVISALDEMESLVKCIEMGAEDYLPKPLDPVLLKARIGACLEQKRLRDQEVTYLQQIEREKKRADDLLNVVIPLGAALRAEQDFDRLLERIVLEAKSFCNADAGTLYLRTEDDRLEFVIVRNDSLGIAMGGTTGREVSFPPLHLCDETTGEPNRQHIVTRVTLEGAPVNVPDAYQAEGFDFSGTRAFDAKTGYRSTSFLTIPLKDSLNQVIGVLQLINALDPETGQVIPFDEGLQQMLESMSLLAAVALEAYIRERSLRQEIQQLHIELDQAKRAHQVAEITETPYFQQLQARAKDLREKV